MAYFPDLTDYRYGKPEPGLLNIGWLEAGQPFPTGRTERVFHDALAKCVCHRVNIYRGWHTCDLCDHDHDDHDHAPPYNLDGREIGGGNGEIRVRSPLDERFCAPTLVLHYVTCHGYKPPDHFIDAVMHTAPQLYVVAGSTLASITQMSVAQRYQICVEVFRSASTLTGGCIAPAAYTALRDLGYTFKGENMDGNQKKLLELLAQLEPSQVESPLHLLWYCVKWFPLFSRDPGPETDDLTIRRAVLSLEEGQKTGIAIDTLESFVRASAR